MMSKQSIKEFISYSFLMKLLSDKLYCSIHYLISCKRILNLKKPILFNEKIQWLKLYDRNPFYSSLVDKIEVKEFVRLKIGDDYIIPTIAIYDSFDQINFNELPCRFVLKCSHDSGGIVIVDDKEKLDIDVVKNKINKHLKKNYFWLNREWPYKNVNPRLIIEEYIEDKSVGDLRDYKFFCFNGKVKLIQVDFDRFSSHKRNLFDVKWNYIPAMIHYPTYPDIEVEKPKNLELMIELAEKLGKDIPFVRVDFYNIQGKIFFGEMTFHHGGGYEYIRPIEFEKELGSYIRLKEDEGE